MQIKLWKKIEISKTFLKIPNKVSKFKKMDVVVYNKIDILVIALRRIINIKRYI